MFVAVDDCQVGLLNRALPRCCGLLKAEVVKLKNRNNNADSNKYVVFHGHKLHKTFIIVASYKEVDQKCSLSLLCVFIPRIQDKLHAALNS